MLMQVFYWRQFLGNKPEENLNQIKVPGAHQCRGFNANKFGLDPRTSLSRSWISQNPFQWTWSEAIDLLITVKSYGHFIYKKTP